MQLYLMLEIGVQTLVLRIGLPLGVDVHFRVHAHHQDTIPDP